jgi:hypothetical protein
MRDPVAYIQDQEVAARHGTFHRFLHPALELQAEVTKAGWQVAMAHP